MNAHVHRDDRTIPVFVTGNVTTEVWHNNRDCPRSLGARAVHRLRVCDSSGCVRVRNMRRQIDFEEVDG